MRLERESKEGRNERKKEETYQSQGIAQQDISRRVIRQFVRQLLQVSVDLVVGLGDLHGRFVDLVFFPWGEALPSVEVFFFLFSEWE